MKKEQCEWNPSQAFPEYGQRAGYRRMIIALFTLVAAAVVLAACDSGAATDEQDRAKAGNAGEEMIIPVEGMACVACVSKVNRTLTGTEGIQSAEADLSRRQVRVRSDADAVAADEIVAAIRELGYKPGVPRRPDKEE